MLQMKEIQKKNNLPHESKINISKSHIPSAENKRIVQENSYRQTSQIS